MTYLQQTNIPECMFLQFFAFYKFARNHFRKKDFLTNLINPFLNFRRRV